MFDRISQILSPKRLEKLVYETTPIIYLLFSAIQYKKGFKAMLPMSGEMVEQNLITFAMWYSPIDNEYQILEDAVLNKIAREDGKQNYKRIEDKFDPNIDPLNIAVYIDLKINPKIITWKLSLGIKPDQKTSNIIYHNRLIELNKLKG